MSGATPPTPLARRVLTLLLVLLGVYAAACVAMFVLQDRFVWVPSRAMLASPDQVGLEHRELELVAEDGVRLHGWMIGPPAAAGETAGAVLVCHGNAGNVSSCLGLAQGFRAMGYAVLLFDYRGYGRSEGRPDERGTYLDAAAAWRHLVEVEGYAPERVAVFGQSLGGAVAARLAREVSPGAVVVENTFTSAADFAAVHYRALPVRLLLRVRYPTLEDLAAGRAPRLVIHSPEDDVVGFAHGERLHAELDGAELLVTGGGHNAGGFLQRAEWRAAVRRFLERSLP